MKHEPEKPKPLRHANEKYDGEVQVGDHVIFQCFREPIPELYGDHPVTTIKVLKVSQVDLESGTFIPEDEQKLNQPLYRIKHIIKDGKAYEYGGYDFRHIAMDEGDITEETYNAIKKLEKEGKIRRQ